MRRWALIQNGIVTRVADGLVNPFHASQRVVDVTGMDIGVGYVADAQGNTRPGVAMSLADATVTKKQMLRSETDFQILRGVWLPKGDEGGALFDVHHEALASLAAMAAAGAGHVPDMDGNLVEIDAAEVFKTAGQHIADCFEHEMEVMAKLDDEPETDITKGWPDNGEPSETQEPSPVVAADLAQTDVAGAQSLQGAVPAVPVGVTPPPAEPPVPVAKPAAEKPAPEKPAAA